MIQDWVGSSRDPSRLRNRHERMSALDCLVQIVAVGNAGRTDGWNLFGLYGMHGQSRVGKVRLVLDLRGWECRGRGMYARANRLCGKQDLN